ncbi:MAG: biotin/lipoyl-containing protein [Candidatus Dormibacteria bacterium]
MPSVGQTTDELVIVEWLKHEGDAVALGESLFSVQTDKAQVDVESVAAGTLLKVLRDVGDVVRAGSPVAYIGAPGEPVPDSTGADSADIATATVGVADNPVAPPVPRADSERRSPEPGPARVAALPAARRLATERGVDLTKVVGTGPDAVITVRDVEQAARDASLRADDSNSSPGRAT